MHIWIDGDACPKVIKEILYRAAIRTQTSLTIVANHSIDVPPSPLIKRLQVNQGFDVADNQIIMRIKPGDLVVTADIPLADAIISNGGLALNPRGELYSINNIKQHLSIRNFNDSLRSNGMITGGLNTLSKKEIQTFANHLDKILTVNCRGN